MSAHRGSGESLSSRADRLKRAMADAHRGPLIASGEVIALVDDWASYEAEAGGMTAAAWVRSVFGKGKTVKWFRRRVVAVKLLGESIRRTWDHGAAVWVAGLNLTEKEWEKLRDAEHAARKKDGGNPLSEERVRRLAQAVGVVRAPRHSKVTCDVCEELKAKCARLEAQLRGLGVEPLVGVAVAAE